MGVVVHPFPWSSLDAVSRHDVEAMGTLRALARASASLTDVAAALGELVDGRVHLRRGRVHAGVGRASSDAVGVLLSFADASAITRPLLIVLDGALAAALTAKALRQRPPRITDPTKPPGPELAGASAAVVLAALRRGSPIALRVVAAGPAAALERDLENLHGPTNLATAHATVTVDADAFAASLSIPASTARRIGAGPFRKEDLARLEELPIALPLVIASVEATRVDVHALAPGDALVLPPSPLRVATDGTLSGPVVLAPSRTEAGIAADLAEDGRLVVRKRIVARPWDSGAIPSTRPGGTGTLSSLAPFAMPEDPKTTLEDVLEDAPVVVRVELGAVELSAREWADIDEGDVVPLRRKIGAPAILRVGGVEVATGELVQVDGDYAVRILSVRGVSR